MLTVKGKRSLMAHDPVSLLLRKTYEDSAGYTIPRNLGIVHGEEFSQSSDSPKLSGTINIQDHQVIINLASYNPDGQKLNSESWNGEYKLVWLDR